ncbi:MAG: flagellar biosynthetic protein FliR [Zetaproteobacteria bacterium CG12_big_fil_rev_8_21_14_0_65_55_1124]|nr:MAG: flagellar biosynthetic protein FliR [Zetaproteobacteria bacterium CG1_02_55_237]PIS18680.1 MAG: flagellar biosynthetic protein FliR [Zetaproteobacteria bacterium CG08_land_8_20_14_0_20_55_17]PIW43284.1 MAG: flagellar biosynthetic protein FliR [Zetaproteobacteria bacterium CG12_big_fil_rev_8_21_14_0_65_55_1124]PIY53415.1 MAG: flagellar biosynthetic protein FliR [Zetaproteobacteria bacterium CG_4_10_14_0_8_um_filter_55_43]PIZ38682.1 MAG: flagellar biosynthetic protein FliR [Zetaproteobact
MDLPTFSPEDVISFLLVLLRVGTLIMLMPVLGHRLVPGPVKIGLIGLMSLLLYPIVRTSLPQVPSSPELLIVLATQEILIAAMLAMLAQLIFSAAQFAGQIMSYQMGLAIANVFDPASSAQIAVVGQFAAVLAMLVWVSVGAHNTFLMSLVDSFYLMPIGHPWHINAWDALNDAAANMFVLALRMVAPMLLLLFFLYVALGLLARAVPQIQVFFVSFPLTVALGFLSFALAIPMIISLMHDSFLGLSWQVPNLLRALAGS